MTESEKIESILQACIKANPQIIFGEYLMKNAMGAAVALRNELKVPEDHGDPGAVEDCWREIQEALSFGRPIRLADVLLAIKLGGCFVDNYEGVFSIRGENSKKQIWNLRADDLTQQSEETINFLYELLK